MKPKLPHQIRKRQYISLALFAGFVIIFQIFFDLYKSKKVNDFPKLEFTSPTENSVLLSEFNPNELDAKQWQKLGFSEKQVKTILKYKNIVGGNFESKEQLRKCYAISEEKFAQIESYILLPETSSRKGFSDNYYSKFEKKELKISRKFNPDLYSESDWQNMGFSEKQAAAIVKYKNYLGGSFVSKEKFKECFIISDENYSKLHSYLILPEKTPENFEENKRKFVSEKTKINYFEFNPNELNAIGWQKLGFSEKQANVIVNYRDKNLKGSFKSLEDIEKCFVISAEKFNELKPYIKLTIPQNNIQNTSSNSTKTAISKTDFSKTDLNKITFAQLIEFGFDEKAAASYIGFRNKLGGFVIKNQILETYNIDKNIAEKLITISPLTNDNIHKYNLLNVSEEWLKNHPYFKYYANKILFLRVSFPSEKEIFKKLKAKPEDEAKMKLYLQNY